jgi:hypothetical protein
METLNWFLFFENVSTQSKVSAKRAAESFQAISYPVCSFFPLKHFPCQITPGLRSQCRPSTRTPKSGVNVVAVCDFSLPNHHPPHFAPPLKKKWQSYKFLLPRSVVWSYAKFLSLVCEKAHFCDLDNFCEPGSGYPHDSPFDGGLAWDALSTDTAIIFELSLTSLATVFDTATSHTSTRLRNFSTRSGTNTFINTVSM